MNYKCIQVITTKQKKEFINLPKKIYKDDNPQNKKTEWTLLTGSHSLSGCFELLPFLVVDKNENSICRCALTIYHDDKETAFVGFFESIDDSEAVKVLFASVKETAKKRNIKKLTGPVDASIYIRYRFKTNLFKKTYTGEPYNKDYYERLWIENGFKISLHYFSNVMKEAKPELSDRRMERVLRRIKNKGYSILSPNKKTFDFHLKQVYRLMKDTYTDFPCYKPISDEDFISLFKYLKHILNFNMVKLAYKDGRLAGFCIAVPDYDKNTLGKITIKKLLNIRRIKRNPERYIVLYAGARPDCVGVGTALIQDIFNCLAEKKLKSVSALIRDENMTGKLYENLCEEKYEYSLLSCEIYS